MGCGGAGGLGGELSVAGAAIAQGRKGRFVPLSDRSLGVVSLRAAAESLRVGVAIGHVQAGRRPFQPRLVQTIENVRDLNTTAQPPRENPTGRIVAT